MENKVKAIIANVLNVDVVTIDDNASNQTIPAWDSLSHMNIIYAAEEQFGITFDDEEMLKLTSYKSLVAAIRKSTTVD